MPLPALGPRPRGPSRLAAGKARRARAWASCSSDERAQAQRDG